MTLTKKDQIRALLKSIETGDSGPVVVVNEDKYIQHNPQTQEGSEGLAALFKRLSKTSPRVNIVRAFEDGDFVFAHTEYDFANRNVGFEVFRFDEGQAVEHWDNIQQRQKPNQSGHSMVDGPTEAVDHQLTESNRALVRSFMETVLIKGEHENLENYVDAKSYTEHNPRIGAQIGDGLSSLRSALEVADNGHRTIDYQRIHRVLAEGNFVLCVSEGFFGGAH
jgi:predicted SnoaL-like aldol condensation-catalyzing enzyme